ncbi:3-oxoacid CoA-transferase subunit A [Xylanimonas ulmi]|uniref:3-oxoadipate CoA-transferase alpha subunit n=1 Tax=Xylanimonas ulmi TaxID=228973 RepID=A0A4Q7LZ51_9MICO|nr:3-oxoacid CoA-transferase subunit A [Xylanibacterium ulmi]RZS60214.1 3-oxoadipate CoA-transferase alpha subunit [Xylanibacterium ulmi]
MTRVRFAQTPAEALGEVADGATVMIGGFGPAGQPAALVEALLAHDARDLVIISNNAGNGDDPLARLVRDGRVRKIVCSFPRQTDSWHFDDAYRAGRVELELVPQGNLAERIRAAGAGIGGFYTPTGFGTPLAAGKETRRIDGVDHVFELPLRADLALVRAHRADGVGNLVYRKTARNFGPIMAAAAARAVVQVDEVVPTGGLDPEAVVTPGIYVSAVVASASRERAPV